MVAFSELSGFGSSFFSTAKLRSLGLLPSPGLPDGSFSGTDVCTLLFCSAGAVGTEPEDLEEADDELLELLFLDPDLEGDDSELLELDELL